MRKLFYGTYAFFGKMLNLSSVVFVVGGGGDCVMFTGSPTPTAAAASGLCTMRRTSFYQNYIIQNKGLYTQ